MSQSDVNDDPGGKRKFEWDLSGIRHLTEPFDRVYLVTEFGLSGFVWVLCQFDLLRAVKQLSPEI